MQQLTEEMVMAGIVTLERMLMDDGASYTTRELVDAVLKAASAHGHGDVHTTQH